MPIRIFYIYRITNKINNKVYIGQSVNPRRRWIQHCNKNSECVAIRNAIQKYGKHNFEFIVIDESCSLEEINNLEVFI